MSARNPYLTSHHRLTPHHEQQDPTPGAPGHANCCRCALPGGLPGLRRVNAPRQTHLQELSEATHL
ncbi:hypothetical protein OH76DRAFT_1403567 [Lentinus brumalis]|uniref:Uncharacterized protein n=1 Tax=Lentinus brumalis TaxID=2498619 RepID=A0A371DAV2_9APHY|nr:hypothetical protein OH76DRAFT_1403567 [Polyporus brumalis]